MRPWKTMSQGLCLTCSVIPVSANYGPLNPQTLQCDLYMLETF